MIDKNRHDVSQVFLVFMALVGDVAKVALALDLPESEVQEMADREGWTEKVRRISIQSKSGQPGDWEKAQNRALNFVQCHQLRRSIDRVIAHIAEQVDAGKTLDLIEHKTKDAVNYSAKLFTELAKAMQAVHEMTYSALGDTVKERDPEGSGKDAALTSAALHASLIGALNNSKLKDTPPELLVKDAVAAVEQLKSAKPESPVT